MRTLKIFVAIAIIFYLLILIVFFVTQRTLLYYPTRNSVLLADANANPAFKELTIKTSDGLALKSWYAPAANQPFTIVFFHGNADSLYTASQIADPYIAKGYGFLLIEYRGYSGLPGHPTENGLYADARANIRTLIEQGVPERKIILFGHSLGTGVAVEMAREFRVGGLMLLAPYLSMPEVARVHFPFVPASLLALDRFENGNKIADIHTNLLIVNGTRDEVIPPAEGNKLFLLAREPKEFDSIQGRGHNDAFEAFIPISVSWISRTCNPN